MKRTLLALISVIAIFGCSKDETKTEITPVSEFTYSVDASNKMIINFQNSSHYINSDTKYIWSFGDGDTSKLENPKHTYLAVGKYSVVLKVINGDYIDCSDQKINVSTITPDSSAIPPVVSFVYSQKGRSVIFQNTSSGIDSKTTFFWSFGDGATSVKEDTAHLYVSDGLYSVVLKVTSNYKTYCYSKSIFVSEANIPSFDTIAPIPSFTYYYEANKVHFVNTSSYTTNATNYFWDFGDGKSSEIENAEHTFSNGTYNVVLKVSNSKYTVACTHQIEVPYVNRDYDWNNIPKAGFVYRRDGNYVYFLNASSNVTNSTKYKWTVSVRESNEWVTSTEEDFFYYFNTSGTYDVVLKVTNDNVSDTYSEEIVIP